MIRQFEPGNPVVSNAILPLAKPSEEFGTYIPKGVEGTIQSCGEFQGSKVIQVLFHFKKLSGGIMYGVYPIQLKHA